jgi:hypothetical protein
MVTITNKSIKIVVYDLGLSVAVFRICNMSS